MSHLKYSVVNGPRHSVRIGTWQEAGVWWARITIDGVEVAYENLGEVADGE